MENGRPADIKPGTDLEANPGHDGEGRTERVPAALRHARIIASFGNNDFVSITSLADELGVSGMTVRRDLDLLGKRGLLERTHGGAVAAGPLAAATFDEDEPPFEQRMRLQAVEKSSIAAAAAKLVEPGESVGLDVGTSILALASALAPRRDLRVFTNNLRVSMLMAEGKSTVYILGGQVRVPEYSVIGPQAIEGLKSHFLDKVFIGVSGVDANGFYDYSPEDTEVKRAFIASAGSVIVLCDSSKFGRRALSRIVPLEKVNILVTDASPPADLAAALSERGVRIIVAA
ncbi:DeoR/GlpR transcriptional regulator [Agrobacterium rhizogenes]|jgi:DeoR family glycerol-3-phosphate regulon repressor|uniref:Glycerol-3-phosphate transcriptional regulator protein n=2 Tax=Rhizobium rhizogenes TaxID=359 RepID=B9JM88_RHIR8|nr:DeoR/GlpR family DNA-binding transcription regulator [Rhizobium rhizogenes]ACM30839.1 glycerol-3-phosphate transcriptional regulator protein [Rhizobium rhizogenes K84]KEA04551.1 DeoR faimly transcriptional regulator [Rhizobium rhizogenes]MDJ1638401.1 DeoR/GlpR family DNA-binding transcription regulator [Rhizobium rhizogenes]MQB34935.1 DeoR/GlpR transcriptional regulator [Rhizobium rhizogenes]NTF52655.1 DeoR/GlpR transcriptional regulator [Rhizobium rhizogenes]